MRFRFVLMLVVGLMPWLATAQTTTWRLASSYGPGVFHTGNLVQFAADVEKASHGKLKIDVKSDGTLLKLPQIAAAVESGSVDAGETLMTSLSSDPSLRILGADGVPFIVRSYDDAARLWKHQRPLVEAALAARGMTVLYACPWPAQGLFSTRPVQAVADFSGLRMRTYNPTTVSIARQVGAQPVDVSTADLANAFSAGRLDAMITSAVTGVDSKAWAFSKYFYGVKAWFPKNIVVVNTAHFNALDEATRVALRKAAADAETRGWRMSAAASDRANADLATHGMKVETPSFVLRSELDRLGERFSREWLRSTGPQASQVLLGYFSDSNTGESGR